MEPKLLAITPVLLRAAPSNPNVTGGVMNLLQERREVNVRCEVIQMIGAEQAIDERTIALFDAGLADQDANVRLMGAQTVERRRPEAPQDGGRRCGKTRNPGKRGARFEAGWALIEQE